METISKASVKAYSTKITCKYSNAVQKHSKQGIGDLDKNNIIMENLNSQQC